MSPARQRQVSFTSASPWVPPAFISATDFLGSVGQARVWCGAVAEACGRAGLEPDGELESVTYRETPVYVAPPGHIVKTYGPGLAAT